MGKYKIHDLKKVAKQEPINLKTKETRLSEKSFVSAQSAGTVNLKPLQGSHRGLWTGRPGTAIDGIKSSAATPSFHLVPRETIEKRVSGRIAQVIRVAASGLVIVLIINLFNVFSSGLHFKSVLVSSGSSGLNNFLEGVNQSKNFNLSKAETEFLQAQGNFNQALERISFLRTSNSLGADHNVKSLEHLLEAGKNISEAGRLFSESAGNLQHWPDLFVAANKDIALGKKTLATTTDENSDPNTRPPSLTDNLRHDLANVDAAIAKLAMANQNLNLVDARSLPAAYRDSLPQIRDSLAGLETFLNGLSLHFPAILELLGDRFPHRYLVLLQNDTESRPTGGFIGSLLIIDVNDGVISRADFHDVYQYDGQLNEYIEAPEDIAQITTEWRLRDSNYSPDFALSAEKAAWFLQKSKGPSVDTVIAVNQSAIGDLLAEMGPINVPELKADLDSNNFQLILSYLIESKYYGEANPKIILSRVIDAFKQKILSQEDPGALFTALLKEIKDRKILFYSRDTDIQQLFDELNLTPHQAQIGEKEDYLQVIATSVGGNKSDLYMTQALKHNTYISSNGDIFDELTISRAHTWNLEELARWQTILKKFGFDSLPDHFQTILGRGNNKSSMKVYVPLGTQLENAVGLEQSAVLTRHDAEIDKTYLLFPMEVAPGQSQTITLRYKLPFRLNLYPADIYRFTAQKQITIVPNTLTKNIQPSPPLTIEKNSRPQASEGFKFREDFNQVAVILN